MLSKKYVFTFLTGVLRAAISFFTGILIARYLGPDQYGRLAFLLAIFLSVKQITDLGTAQAFFYFMSQKKRTKDFIYKYFSWLFFQLFITIVLIIVIFPNELIVKLWHGENTTMIIVALCASFMQNTLWPAVQQALDSQRKNYLSQGIGATITIAHFLIIYFLIRLEQLGLYSLLFSVLIEYFLAAVLLFKFIDSKESDEVVENGIIKLFFNYCKPLIIYNAIGFTYSFMDAWLLQKFGGNNNQSYFAISSQVASIALLATATITNIFFKEVTEYFYKGINEWVLQYYKKTTRFLFFFATMVTCLALPWIEDIIMMVYGEKFLLASATMLVMFFFPIHQSMGQIQSLFFLGTNNLKLYVNVGIVFMVLSIFITYFLFNYINTYYPDFKNVSIILAFKLVVLQFVQVNIIAYIIARKFKSKLDWIFQPVILLLFISFTYISSFISQEIYLFEKFYFNFIISIVFYLIFTIIFILFSPTTIGIEKEELKKYLGYLKFYK